MRTFLVSQDFGLLALAFEVTFNLSFKGHLNLEVYLASKRSSLSAICRIFLSASVSGSIDASPARRIGAAQLDNTNPRHRLIWSHLCGIARLQRCGENGSWRAEPESTPPCSVSHPVPPGLLQLSHAMAAKSCGAFWQQEASKSCRAGSQASAPATHAFVRRRNGEGQCLRYDKGHEGTAATVSCDTKRS